MSGFWGPCGIGRVGRCVHSGMGLAAAAASNGGPATGIPANDLVPALALLAAAILVVGVLAIGAVVLVRWRKRPPREAGPDLPDLPDAWVEAGRRMKR